MLFLNFIEKLLVYYISVLTQLKIRALAGIQYIKRLTRLLFNIEHIKGLYKMLFGYHMWEKKIFCANKMDNK